MALACVAVVGLAVVLGVYFWTNRPASGTELKSIAVLPFRPLVAGSRDESLEVGMADTLIMSLSNLRPLIIRPTSAVRRYGGLDQDPVAAGRELKVDAVLDGSIQRMGERIRVNVRLIQVRDSSSLWAKQFDEKATDIFAVQDSISRHVVDAMAVRFSSEEHRRLTKHHTHNTEAYQLYVKGRYLWNKRTGEALWKSIEYFNQAIEIDPNYALAYAGLADAYAVLPGHGKTLRSETLPKAKAAALKALDLDSQLPEAHTALATLSADDWNWADAEKQFKRALELNPNYPTAHQWYGEYLVHVGRLDEALQEFKRAQELDPTSIIIQSLLGQTLYLMRRYDEAIEHLQKSLEMESDFVATHWMLGLAYAQKAMHEESRSEFEKAVKLSNGATNLLALLGVAYAKSGNQSAAQNVLDKLNALIRQRRAQPHDLAILYTGLGEKDRAFEWLGKAYEDRSYLILYLKTDPFFDPLRSDPRFSDLLSRAGLVPWPLFPAHSAQAIERTKNMEAGIMNRTANNPINRHLHISSLGPALLVGALSLTALATPHADVQPTGVRNSAGTQRLNNEQLQQVQESLRRNSGFMELRFDQRGALTLGNRQQVQDGSATVRALVIAAVDSRNLYELESHEHSPEVAFARIVESEERMISPAGKSMTIFQVHLDFADFSRLKGARRSQSFIQHRHRAVARAGPRSFEVTRPAGRAGSNW